MKKLTVVFGAGASFDCANDVSSADERWRPPLARELFDIRSRPAFENVLNQYRGARVLGSELAELSRDSTFNLESKLREFANHDDERTRAHFVGVLYYLRHLLREVSHEYVKTPGCYVQLVRRVLSDHPHQVAFVSLNYDNLLEQALQLFGGHSIKSISDYCDSSRQAMVVKVHGSIDWSIHTSQRAVDGIPPRPWNIRFTPERHRAKSEPMHGAFPVLTAPMAGKSSDDLVCPKEHLTRLESFLRACGKFLFIGTKGLDDDVLGFLDSSIRHVDELAVVSTNDVIEVESNILERAPKFRSSKSTQRFSQGFRQFLGSAELSQLLLA